MTDNEKIIRNLKLATIFAYIAVILGIGTIILQIMRIFHG